MTFEAVSVLKIRDVLLLTVPPEPDDRTIAALQEGVLQAMAEHEARGLILDISTVEILDSYFARTIAETVQLVSLMGGRTIIAGMRAPVAITSTQLGLSLGDAATALNVDAALDQLAEDPEPGQHQ